MASDYSSLRLIPHPWPRFLPRGSHGWGHRWEAELRLRGSLAALAEHQAARFEASAKAAAEAVATRAAAGEEFGRGGEASGGGEDDDDDDDDDDEEEAALSEKAQETVRPHPPATQLAACEA